MGKCSHSAENKKKVVNNTWCDPRVEGNEHTHREKMEWRDHKNASSDSLCTEADVSSVAIDGMNE
jgi:hypothetical protein